MVSGVSACAPAGTPIARPARTASAATALFTGSHPRTSLLDHDERGEPVRGRKIRRSGRRARLSHLARERFAAELTDAQLRHSGVLALGDADIYGHRLL